MTTTILTARRMIAADTTIDYPRISILADGIIAAIEPGDPTAD